MVKIVVNPGRKVWDRENHREATGGDVLEVKAVEAKILKHRGHASDAPPEPPQPTPKPTPPPPPPPPAEPPQASLTGTGTSEDQRMVPRGPRTYRRRDMQPEEGA